MTKLMILNWGDNPELCGWTQCINKGSCEREMAVGGSHQHRVTGQQRQRDRRDRLGGVMLLA